MGLALGSIFAIAGFWIWLNLAGYTDWYGYWAARPYAGYTMPLMILGVFLFVVGYAFIWRSEEEQKTSQAAKD